MSDPDLIEILQGHPRVIKNPALLSRWIADYETGRPSTPIQPALPQLDELVDKMKTEMLGSELDEALALASEGFSIFPLHRARVGIDGVTVCTCGKTGCDGKHPRVPFSEWATTDKDKIRRFWEKHPESNVGIHLGRSHCFVIDIDGPEGMKEWAGILETLGLDTPDTRIVASGRVDGGTHIYFARWVKPAIPNGKLSENVHIKGSAGNAYVVAPPSVHVSGSRYKYVSRTTANEPDGRLIDLILQKKEFPAQRNPVSRPNPRDGKGEIPLTRLLSAQQLSALKDEGNLLIGFHPVHPTPDSPREFSIDKTRNRWRCWWHESGGGMLELAAVLTGLCKCEEFSKDNLIKPLSGRNFTRSILAAMDLGISKDDIKKYLGVTPS